MIGSYVSTMMCLLGSGGSSSGGLSSLVSFAESCSLLLESRCVSDLAAGRWSVCLVSAPSISPSPGAEFSTSSLSPEPSTFLCRSSNSFVAFSSRPSTIGLSEIEDRDFLDIDIVLFPERDSVSECWRVMFLKYAGSRRRTLCTRSLISLTFLFTPGLAFLSPTSLGNMYTLSTRDFSIDQKMMLPLLQPVAIRSEVTDVIQVNSWSASS